MSSFFRQKMEKIQDMIHVDREKAYADANYYRQVKDAEANALLLTPSYLQLEGIKALSNLTKIYYGEKIPNFITETSIGASVCPSQPAKQP